MREQCVIVQLLSELKEGQSVSVHRDIRTLSRRT